MTDNDTPVMTIMMAGTALQTACHHASATAGWWGKLYCPHPGDVANEPLAGLPFDVIDVRSSGRMGKLLIAQKLCLIHSEVSEAMEGFRKDLMDDKLPHRKMGEVELADAVIRCFDLAGACGFDLGAAIAEKMAFNAVRPDHKLEVRAAAGGKAF